MFDAGKKYFDFFNELLIGAGFEACLMNDTLFGGRPPSGCCSGNARDGNIVTIPNGQFESLADTIGHCREDCMQQNTIYFRRNTKNAIIETNKKTRD